MVKSVPPLRINGSARCAIRMKVQHDTSNVVAKPSRETSTTRPCNASLGEKAIERAPHFADLLEKSFHLTRHAHVKRHDNRGLQRLCERVHKFFGLVV